VIRWSSVLESGNPASGVQRVGRWSPGRSSLESGRASSALQVLAPWSSVFSIPDSSDFARSPADHPWSSGWSPGISDWSPVISALESSDFGLESSARRPGVQSARAWSSGMAVSESQSDGRYGPTRLRVQRRTPFSDRRNHVSDAERVKSVCWRGSPDPLQRPRSTGCWEKVSTEASRGRARFAVVHID